MPRDHYLPASVIGRFATDNAGPARERLVFVLRRGQKTAYQMRAKNIGYAKDLYSVSPELALDGTSTSVDPKLHGYEPALPQALDLLDRSAEIDITTWLRTLVPYVASVFVRGNDFIPRFQERPSVAGASTLNTSENANAARFIELERLLAPVCCAQWTVLHKAGGESFVLNDLGLIGTTNLSTGEAGWAVPISKDSVLGIFPEQRRPVAQYRAGKWWALIAHGPLNAMAARGFNDATARFATSYLIGPDPQVAERLAPLIGENSDPRNLMESWPFEGKTLRAHAWDWHRLISATAANLAPDELGDLHNIDIEALAKGWCPPIGIILNMREFPTGLARVGNMIELTMETPLGPEDYSAEMVDPEAIPLFEQTLADRERVLGPDHPDTLGSRNNLALAYREAGRVAEAIPLFEQTLADHERVLDRNHPATFTSRTNLATAYQAAGRVAEAIPLFEQLLADHERVLGRDHPATFTSRNDLAIAYWEAGRVAEAIPLFEQILADRERVLGPDHPDTLGSRDNLALVYREAGRTR
jgi:tetratricopeptide (TPR) repeat protein